MAKIINIDDRIQERVGAPKEVPTQQVTLFGREWDVQVDLNSYTITAILAGDAAGYVSFLQNVVIPEQRRDFHQALAGQAGLTAERLLAIVEAIIEVAGGDDGARPTKRSSGSSPGETTPPTARKSAVRTSARTGGPSTRRR